MDTFFLFLLVGVLAQAVDGALGMAYGVISSSVLLAFGVPPATASASVHAAEVFTTAASAGSHAWHRNVEWRLFLPLAIAGVIGGVLGAYVLTGIDGAVIKPFIIGYLALVGVWILWRAGHDIKLRRLPTWVVGPLGLVGGFLDAVGGGGWGPVVTSTLLGSGADPRKAIGTTNAAEAFVAAAVSAAFLAALVSGHWETDDLAQHLWSVLGLIAGGVVAAPLAGWMTKVLPVRALTWIVGILVTGLAIWQAVVLFS